MPGSLNEQAVVLRRARSYVLLRVALDVIALVVLLAEPPAQTRFPLYWLVLADLTGLAAYWLLVPRRPAVTTYVQLVYAAVLILAIDFSLGRVTVASWLLLIPLGLAGGLIIARPGFNSLVTVSILLIFGLYSAALLLGRLDLPMAVPVNIAATFAIAVSVILIALSALTETLVVHLYQTQTYLVQTQVQLFQTTLELEQQKHELYDVQRDVRRHDRLSAGGQIARQVSKSLQAPLSAIDSTLSQPQATLAQPETLAAVHTHVHSALHMLEGLDRFASLGPMRPQTINMDDLLVGELSGLTVSPEVTVRLDKPPILPPIEADPDHMHQLVHQLLANAIEAVGAAGTITVSLASAPEGVRLTVSDTGPGIPPSQIELIFEPLYTTRPQGFGLGLAICQQVVRMQGGRIEVQSTVGRGTTFGVYLPRLPRNLAVELAQDVAG